ncbi:MAG: cupin domain-containing protein [Candidatus Sericytochromatia bacterium]
MSELQLPPIVNLKDVEFTLQQQGEQYEAQSASLGRRLGSRKLGSQLVIVPPGKRAWPYHAHYVNEEMFFILAGDGVLRIHDKEYLITSGDLVSIPPGPQFAHELINTSADEELTYLSISTMEDPDIIIYPESNEISVVAGSPPGGNPALRTLDFRGVLNPHLSEETPDVR